MPRTLLSALLNLDDEEKEVHDIPLEKIKVNPNQPREFFPEESIDDLAASIQGVGLIQPIVVRKLPSGDYELVAGERRLRACKKLGMKRINALVRKLSDSDALTLALIENLQRENLTPIEEAKAYRSLMGRFNISQQQLARKVGKSQPLISNLLKLLNLPDQVQQMVTLGKLNQGHGRALLALVDPQSILSLAQKALENEWSAKDLERVIAELKSKSQKPEPETPSSTLGAPDASIVGPASRRELIVEQLNLFRDTLLGSLKTFTSRVGFHITTEERESDDFYEILLKIRKP